MLKVLEYRKQLKALKEEGNGILTKSETEKRDMSAEEKKRFDAIDAEMTALEGRMDNYIKVNRIDLRELQTPPTPKGEPEPTKAGPFRSFGEQLQSVAAFYQGRSNDPKLYEVRAPTGMGETIPSDGGFLVQQDFTQTLLTRVYNTNEIPNRCRRIPVSSASNSLVMKTVDETSRADGSRWGGIRAYWEAEGDSTTPTKPKIGRLEMKLEKLMGVCYATDELLSDNAALGAIITQGFTEEFGFKLSDAIVRGTGAGQPLGILSSGAVVSVAKETGQSADTVETENILKMWRSRWGRSFVWLYNQELEDQLETLTIAIGTGGETAKLFTPPGAGQTYGSIKGQLAIPVEQASGPGDVGDVILADLSQYILIDKGGLQQAESIHVQFLTDQTVFRFIYRVNGQPAWKTYLTPYKRTSSTYYQSPFVTLAAR